MIASVRSLPSLILPSMVSSPSGEDRVDLDASVLRDPLHGRALLILRVSEPSERTEPAPSELEDGFPWDFHVRKQGLQQRHPRLGSGELSEAHDLPPFCDLVSSLGLLEDLCSSSLSRILESVSGWAPSLLFSPSKVKPRALFADEPQHLHVPLPNLQTVEIGPLWTLRNFFASCIGLGRIYISSSLAALSR